MDAISQYFPYFYLYLFYVQLLFLVSFTKNEKIKYIVILHFTSIVSLHIFKYNTTLSKIRCYFVKFKRDVMLIYCIRAIDVLAIPHCTTDVSANCYEYPYHVISIKHKWDEFFWKVKKSDISFGSSFFIRI